MGIYGKKMWLAAKDLGFLRGSKVKCKCIPKNICFKKPFLNIKVKYLTKLKKNLYFKMIFISLFIYLFI